MDDTNQEEATQELKRQIGQEQQVAGQAKQQEEAKEGDLDASSNGFGRYGGMSSVVGEEGTPPSDEWIESVSGRDWEIFWKKNSTMTIYSSKQNQNNNIEDNDQEEGKNVEPKRRTMRTAHRKAARRRNVKTGRKQHQQRRSITPATTRKRTRSAGRKGAEEEIIDEDDDEQSIPDWYDAQVESFLGLDPSDKNLYFHVRFVGEETTLYKMALTPLIVRPRSQDTTATTNTTTIHNEQSTVLLSQQQEQLEWANQWVGHECEIFWRHSDAARPVTMETHSNNNNNNVQQDTKTTTTLSDEAMQVEKCNETHTTPDTQMGDEAMSDAKDQKKQEDDEEEEEEDWYDASIEEFVCKGKNRAIFKVRFVGDETAYAMALTPSLVRPSARAWVRRTRAILIDRGHQQQQQKLPFARWEKELPPRTDTLDDQVELEAIRDRVRSIEFPPLKLNLRSTGSPTQKEHENVCQLIEIIREQKYLRSKLSPNVLPEGESSASNSATVGEDDPDPTEAYLNHLLQVLQDLEEACVWHYHCWRLHWQILAPKLNSSPDNDTNISVVSRGYLMNECLMGGRKVISTLVSMDTSLAGSKRKRSSSAAAATTGTRRTKRRRKMKGYTDFWTENEIGQRTFNDELDQDDFSSTEMVKQLVDRLNAQDLRWYTAAFGKMLKSLTGTIIAVLLKWEKRVAFYLGETDSLGEKHDDNDDEMAEEEPGSDGDDDDDEDKSDPSIRFVSYEDIESAISLTKNDKVLRVFAESLAERVSRLESKLAAIDSFEEKAWKLVGSLLDDNVTSTQADRDETIKTLRQLLATASSTSSGLANVDPLGRPRSSPMSRAVLENAMVCRTWFLDLLHVESIRERVDFVEAVVSRHSRLPSLPKLPDSNENNKERGETDVSSQLKEMAPRVQALSAKCAKHKPVFAEYESKFLNDSTGEEGDEAACTLDKAKAALAQLGSFPFISLTEEKLCVRCDTMSWGSRAEPLLSKSDLSYDELASLKQSLDLILDGSSSTRSELISSTRANPSVDAEIRKFAGGLMTALYDSLVQRARALFASSTVWREKANSVLAILRAFGNELAGEPTVSQKPAAMVELRRVGDLLCEYKSIGVGMDDVRQKLGKIHEDSTKWSNEVLTFLLEASNSFESCLALVRGLGRERPKGIIVEPTRQTVDLLEETFRWYTQSKECHVKVSVDDSLMTSLLGEGIEIVIRYSGSWKMADFTAQPSETAALVAATLQKPIKPIAVSRLEANVHCSKVLQRMVEVNRDIQDGGPIFSLLFWLWKAFVADFVQQAASKASSKEKLTLKDALKLKSSRPSMTDASGNEFATNVSRQTFPEITRLEELVVDAQRVEQNAKTALSNSKPLLREATRRHDDVRSHLVNLKSLLSDLKGRGNGEIAGLSLDSSLEQLLDQDSKLFTWLVRTLQYRALLSDDIEDEMDDHDAEIDARIPWDVLVGLKDRIPSTDCEKGDFPCIVLRVKELHEAASLWQDEISNLTKLSLRGGKRRSNVSAQSPTKPAFQNETTEDGLSSTVDVEKVMELCHHPVLSKVLMPRENGMRDMLEGTREFENQLYEFLGKDYDGEGADRTAYPRAGSLVGDDGTFLLYKLTGSPLFQKLKSSIASISEVASKVLADTPGKEAFNWICKAVGWIESINAAVSAAHFPFEWLVGRRLAIPGASARSLLENGEKILLNVPDDLRRTLSKHGISVSTNKDGKLTVKSKKGGSHYAVGTTAIRWCPFLFESLRADANRLKAWEKSVSVISHEFVKFRRMTEGSLPNSDSILLQFFKFQEDLNSTLEEGSDLFVSPSKGLVDSCLTLLSNIGTYIQAYPGQNIPMKFAELSYTAGDAQVANRFLLLDSLLQRKSLLGDDEREPVVDVDPKQRPFRHACRIFLQKALLKGMHTLSLGEDEEAMKAMCAVRAWEIENALFEKFQTKLGEAQISDEYRDKARALRPSLEDVDNVLLCARVLSAETSAHDLVEMSTEELANPKTKQLRAKASARQNIVLTRAGARYSGGTGFTTSTSSEKQKDAPSDKKTVATSTLKNEQASADNAGRSDAVVGGMSDAITENETTHDKDTGKQVKDAAAAAAAATATATATTAAKTPTPSPGAAAATANNAKSRPPPPPSLVASLLPTSSRRDTQSTWQSSHESRLKNDQGSDEFYLSVADSSRHFAVHLCYPDKNSKCSLDGILPESLNEKGRLHIPEFSKFVSGKLESGRWISTVFRLVPCAHKDEREYKKFYKDYESKKRIAMFSLSQNGGKIFLVTPKFHRNAPSIQFEKSTSTYAVVLTRR